MSARWLWALLVVGCACESTPSDDVRDDASTPPVVRGCKRGVAYGHHSIADFAALGPAISWWYNWHHLPDDALRDGSYRAQGVEYVPMVWGRDFDADTHVREIPEGATTLLGFNEPNFASQANLSAADAAALWPEVERIADERGLLLVSPAVNYCGGDCQDTDPFRYLEEFFAACPDCRVDRIAIHVYVGCRPEGDDQARWLIDHVRRYEERFTQPIWLTEFACTDAANVDEQIAFLEDAVAFLESDPRIERYAWFSGRFEGIDHVDLLGADGELTALGRAYVEAPASPDCER
ncbi:glycoside hydrolase family protein [Sandaracinus amylolyticus]|uniref:Putative secreted protein n=1 Tax=Sandaracinus amylolyticus TaxID=927083 RepID=A0A0F6W9T7_9BACT|nr:glycoside hydrolase family protein [Sandaracinus amylolyticus]AKF11093.1 putative secreted protein [Sandaracinus amylolyticus]